MGKKKAALYSYPCTTCGQDFGTWPQLLQHRQRTGDTLTSSSKLRMENALPSWFSAWHAAGEISKTAYAALIRYHVHCARIVSLV